MDRDGHAVAAHDPHERRHVILVRMNAARRDEPHQVAAAPAFTQPPDEREEGRVAGKRAVGHGVVDAGQVLQNDPACADGHVPDLRVPHLTLRQAYGFAGGGEQAPRAVCGEPVPYRRFGKRDGVVLRLLPMPPPIQHAKDDGAV